MAVECSGCFLLDLFDVQQLCFTEIVFISILPFRPLSYVWIVSFFFFSQKVAVTETTQILPISAYIAVFSNNLLSALSKNITFAHDYQYGNSSAFFFLFVSSFSVRTKIQRTNPFDDIFNFIRYSFIHA